MKEGAEAEQESNEQSEIAREVDQPYRIVQGGKGPDARIVAVVAECADRLKYERNTAHD